MASRGVRVSTPPQDAPQIRRRPRQSRAQASAQALQDAFVRVLLERGYEKTTIREVAAVAGVGVGTFYEYFGNMRALAALCIHQRVKALADAGQAAVDAARGRPLAQVLDAQLDVQVGQVMAEAPVWAALFLVERQVSTPQAFRKHYEAYVALWQRTRVGGRAQRWPELSPPPFRLRLGRGGGGVACAKSRLLRELTRCGCLSEARSA